jgi:hypothetical protein
MKELDVKYKKLKRRVDDRPQINAMEHKRDSKRVSSSSSSEAEDVEDILEMYLAEAGEIYSLEDPLSQKQCNQMMQQDVSRLDTTWILDFGATSHVTSNPNLISGLKPVAAASMTAAGGEVHQV